jgi:hypothetical protein
MEPSVQLGPDFFPRNCLDLAGVHLTDSTLYLFSPRRFDVLIGLTMKAFQKTAGKFRPIGFGQFGRLSKELSYISCHD